MKIIDKMAWLIGWYCITIALSKCIYGIIVWLEQIRKHITEES